MVYRLCAWRNSQGDVPAIPPPVLTKPPSAELRPDQRDDESLPPYEVLDPVLLAYVEDDQTAAELVDAGHPAELVDRIVRLVDLAEYKRRQTPPGIRVPPKPSDATAACRSPTGTAEGGRWTSPPPRAWPRPIVGSSHGCSRSSALG